MHSYSVKYPEVDVPKVKKGVKEFLASIENKGATIESVPVKKQPKSVNHLQVVLSFLEKLSYSYTDGKVLVHTNLDKEHRKLQYLLLNPSSQFEEVVNEARSVTPLLFCIFYILMLFILYI